MSKRFVAALLGMFALSILAAFDQEGKVHVMGTIAGIDDHHVIVKDTSGKTATTAAALKVGKRVMVDVVGEGTKATASEIRLGIQEMPAGHAGMDHGAAKPNP